MTTSGASAVPTEHFDRIEVPLYSVGVWGKVDLHTRGNIDGFCRAKRRKEAAHVGPVQTPGVANREFNSRELHEKMLLPFYDHYLKGKRRNISSGRRSNISCAAPMPCAAPKPGRRRRRAIRLVLERAKSGSVTSLNDGATGARQSVEGAATTTYKYPDPGWMMGVVGFGPTACGGRSGTPRADLYHRGAGAGSGNRRADKAHALASSTRDDTDFFVKLSEQMPQSPEDRAKDTQPVAILITKAGCVPRIARSIRKKHRDGAVSHAQRSAADRARKKSISSTSAWSRWPSLPEGPPRAAGNRQRRFPDQRASVAALLQAE